MNKPTPPQHPPLSALNAHNAVAQLVEMYASILADHQREQQLLQAMLQQSQQQARVQRETSEGQIATLKAELEALKCVRAEPTPELVSFCLDCRRGGTPSQWGDVERESGPPYCPRCKRGPASPPTA